MFIKFIIPITSAVGLFFFAKGYIEVLRQARPLFSVAIKNVLATFS